MDAGIEFTLLVAQLILLRLIFLTIFAKSNDSQPYVVTTDLYAPLAFNENAPVFDRRLNSCVLRVKRNVHGGFHRMRIRWSGNPMHYCNLPCENGVK